MTIWKKPELPRSVVQMMPVDHDGNILFLHRSKELRSARNIWSFPSGLHDIGETIKECAIRELHEELSLIPTKFELVGFYENIAGDTDATEQYHWNIIVVGALIPNGVNTFVNNEPDKHDIIRVLKLEEVFNSPASFIHQHPFHSSFNAFFLEHASAIYNKLRILTLP